VIILVKEDAQCLEFWHRTWWKANSRSVWSTFNFTKRSWLAIKWG